MSEEMIGKDKVDRVRELKGLKGAEGMGLQQGDLEGAPEDQVDKDGVDAMKVME